MERRRERAAIGAVVLTKPLIERAWRLAFGAEPPGNPAHQDVSWRDAILWALVTGAIAGVIRLVAQRLAARAWQKARGSYPKELASTPTVTPGQSSAPCPRRLCGRPGGGACGPCATCDPRITKTSSSASVSSPDGRSPGDAPPGGSRDARRAPGCGRCRHPAPPPRGRPARSEPSDRTSSRTAAIALVARPRPWNPGTSVIPTSTDPGVGSDRAGRGRRPAAHRRSPGS